jgi:hypothetical protein
MFCYIYGDYFSLYVPGQIEAFMNGKTLLVSPLKLLAASILMTIPPLMIFLSLTLKPNINRLSNVIFGTIYSIIMMLIALDSIEPWWTFMVFLAIAEILITLQLYGLHGSGLNKTVRSNKNTRGVLLQKTWLP